MLLLVLPEQRAWLAAGILNWEMTDGCITTTPAKPAARCHPMWQWRIHTPGLCASTRTNYTKKSALLSFLIKWDASYVLWKTSFKTYQLDGFRHPQRRSGRKKKKKGAKLFTRVNWRDFQRVPLTSLLRGLSSLIEARDLVWGPMLPGPWATRSRKWIHCEIQIYTFTRMKKICFPKSLTRVHSIWSQRNID
jgi:hypothetical protein